MSLTLSPAVKIFALLGVLATLALGAGMFVLGGAEEDVVLDEAALVAEIKLAKKTAKSANARTKVSATGTATKPKAKATAKPATKPVAKPAAKPAAKPKATPKPKAKAKPAVAANGLPTSIVSALASSPVVVVSLFDDAAKVDPMAHDEAQAGAKLANVGFVALDVTRDQKAAEALMLKLGSVLRAPMVLFFVRSGELKLALDGFRDRDTVAQAALNVLR